MKVNKVWLALLAVIPVFAFAGVYETVVDDSVVGYWWLRTGRGGG